jgi:branched-chain amino acid transport system ATP-binding protein
MLSIQSLNFSYGDMKVLYDVSLEVKAGEIVSVIGSNGAGKSTILKNISQLVKPSSGSITFNGNRLNCLEPHKVVEAGIIHVPEGRKVFGEMTVMENLMMGGYTAKPDRTANLDKVFTLFPKLKERQNQHAETLSGGEAQMLAIGRGLMANPQVLLLDEPSLGLSPLFTSVVFEAISEINKQGVTVLLIEQNVHQSLRISHRAYVLETGKIVLSGTGEELLNNDEVKKAFLGI